jgi:histidyl-tRNA synthetase
MNENKLPTLAFLITTCLFPLNLSAHSSHDPIKDLAKYETALKQYQDAFEPELERRQKIDNLASQITVLEDRLFTLRDLLARDYPHVKASMSKYKLDYMESVDSTLKDLKILVEQTEFLVK